MEGTVLQHTIPSSPAPIKRKARAIPPEGQRKLSGVELRFREEVAPVRVNVKRH